MAYRYANREIIINGNSAYRVLLKERGLKYFRQFNTPQMKYPNLGEVQGLKSIVHVWRTGDKYYKLSHQYYGDASLWWLIAWYNQKPTEGHVATGDALEIPLPLDQVLSYFGV